MTTRHYLMAMFMGLFALTACGSDDDPVPVPEPTEKPEPSDSTTTSPEHPDTTTTTPSGPDVTETRFVGGDISMLTAYEQQHAAYADLNGKTIASVLDFLKEQGWNTMRVRLFVDPSQDSDKGVVQDLQYVKSLGKRIKDAGLLFMLDFHYSDTWADPGQQTAPASWAVYSWYPEDGQRDQLRHALGLS